jgi:hypothetical protein
MEDVPGDKAERARSSASIATAVPEFNALLFRRGIPACAASNVHRAFGRILKHAGLPAHFTPPCLRNTYASILLAEGKSPAYVQAQLGHASIALTVDTYGKWLPKGDKAVDSLDDVPGKRSGDRVVTLGRGGDENDAQVGDSESGPPRNRTANPLIKSESGYHAGSTSTDQPRKKTGRSNGK